MDKKTDNGNLSAKLTLRRYFLDKYHDRNFHVLDCCQGSGVIWNKLRSEYDLASYWGLDVKRKPGRLRLDSARVLQQPGWSQNVIDVDTYGSPWEHWSGILANFRDAVTVFLTIGQVTYGGSRLINVVRHSLGIGKLKIPNAIGAKLNAFATIPLISTANESATIVEAAEAFPSGNARYIGVRLERNK